MVPVRDVSTPWEGEELALCGFPEGEDLHGGFAFTASFRRLMVSAILPHPKVPPETCTLFQVDGIINGGFSGGPVFRPDSGEIIGIATHRWTKTMDDMPNAPVVREENWGFGLVVPIHPATRVIGPDPSR